MKAKIDALGCVCSWDHFADREYNSYDEEPFESHFLKFEFTVDSEGLKKINNLDWDETFFTATPIKIKTRNILGVYKTAQYDSLLAKIKTLNPKFDKILKVRTEVRPYTDDTNCLRKFEEETEINSGQFLVKFTIPITAISDDWDNICLVLLAFCSK